MPHEDEVAVGAGAIPHETDLTDPVQLEAFIKSLDAALQRLPNIFPVWWDAQSNQYVIMPSAGAFDTITGDAPPTNLNPGEIWPPLTRMRVQGTPSDFFYAVDSPRAVSRAEELAAPPKPVSPTDQLLA